MYLLSYVTIIQRYIVMSLIFLNIVFGLRMNFLGTSGDYVISFKRGISLMFSAIIPCYPAFDIKLFEITFQSMTN